MPDLKTQDFSRYSKKDTVIIDQYNKSLILNLGVRDG